MTRTGCHAVKPGRASGGSRGGTPDQGAVPPTDAVPSPREPQNQHSTKEMESRGRQRGEPPPADGRGFSTGTRLGLDAQMRAPRPSPGPQSAALFGNVTSRNEARLAGVGPNRMAGVLVRRGDAGRGRGLAEGGQPRVWNDRLRAAGRGRDRCAPQLPAGADSAPPRLGTSGLRTVRKQTPVVSGSSLVCTNPSRQLRATDMHPLGVSRGLRAADPRSLPRGR